MAEPGSFRSPSTSGSPSTSRPTSRPGTPIRDSRRGPPPLPASPSKTSPSSSPLNNAYLGYESHDPVQRMTGDYLLPGEPYGSPPKVSNSSLPSNVAADSSSVAALDSKINQEDLKQEFTPSSAGLKARAALEQTATAAKYGVHTKSASDGADVRWYFCKTPLRPNEAAAQVPASEVVGKGDYFRFSVRDSLALEASFVQREEELVSAWWKEYAEVSAGPAKSSGALQIEKEAADEKLRSLSSVSDGRTSLRGPGSTHSDYDDDEESVGVLVKGGLYEVRMVPIGGMYNLLEREHRRVLRGHWYVRKGGLDWLPLREDVAEQLEIAYHKKIWKRRKFQPSGLYAARVDLTGTTLGLHALFLGEDDSWEAALAVDASGLSAILGFQGSGVKLRRGFAPPDSVHPTQDELRQRKVEELDDYASQVPVRHVVFMVHGIGQRLEKANLVDDVGAFRQTVRALSEQHLSSHQRNAQRILFIPCQWRRELKLGGEVAMEQVTLDGVRALRTMITATVHDVLYYMSPVYCQDIIDSVTRSLNRLYTRFIKRNPSFDGKVSLYGHSLGSVLTYDILCHQDTLKSPFPVHSINAAITRNDESEDDMPKIDRLPSAMEHEFISEGETSVQDMLSSPSTFMDSSEINATDTLTNEIIPEVEAVEEASTKETEDIVQEPDKFEAVAIPNDSKVTLQSDFTNKEHTAISEEEDISQERTEVPDGNDIAQEHAEVSEEDAIAREHTEVSEEDDIAEEHTGVAEEDDIAQEHTEVSDKDDIAQEYTGVAEEDDIAQEHTEVSDKDDIAQEHTDVLEKTDIDQEYKAVSEEDNMAHEDSELLEADATLEHTETLEKVEVSELENAEKENEDVKSTEREFLNDLEGANSEKDLSESADAVKPQDTEQDSLQDLAAADIERALDLVDQVMMDSADSYEELSEIDRLKAKVADLQEKLRLMENENQVNSRAHVNVTDTSGETLDHTVLTNKGNLQELPSLAESGRKHHCTGEDSPELRQRSPDNEFGCVRENLETSISARKQHRPFIIYPKLIFKVETFYAVGSPLGMFLALRNIRIGLGTGTEYWQDEGIDEEMPACRLLLNIFHPYDPVAYRLEPLVCKEYVDHKPVFIPYHKGGKRIHIGLQEFSEDLSMKSKAFVNSIGAVGTRVAHVFTSRKDDSLTEEEEQERNRKKAKTYGQLVMERLTGSQEGRIDCMLQDATFEHQYISAISSHTAYWQDPDTALFILKHLYRDIPEELESDDVPTMEALHGMVDDSIDDEIFKPDNTSTYSSPVVSAQDDWDSGDDESTSLFFNKEDFVAALSVDKEIAQAKHSSNQKM